MSQIIRCAHEECPNTLVLGPDDPAPKDWLCPVCDMRADEQQRGEWLEHFCAIAAATPNPILNDIPMKEATATDTLTPRTPLPNFTFTAQEPTRHEKH